MIDINSFVQAIAGKLKELYPNMKVFNDEIEQNFNESCFYINVISTEQSREVDRRRRRIYMFDIMYIPSDSENAIFYDWADVMYNNFEMIQVDTRLYHTKNTDTEQNDRIFHFTFDVDFTYLKEKEGKVMEVLIDKEEYKDE
jgi:hypothetical protein